MHIRLYFTEQLSANDRALGLQGHRVIFCLQNELITLTLISFRIPFVSVSMVHDTRIVCTYSLVQASRIL